MLKRLLFALLVVISVCALSFSVCAQEYDLYVGDVRVTSENCNDVFGDADEGVTVTYNPDTDTLTLDNAYISTFSTDEYWDCCCGISSYSSLNIELVGENVISVFPDEDMIDEMTIGIQTWGNLTIHAEEEASLYVNVGKATRETFGVYAREYSELKVTGKTYLEVTLDSFTVTDERAVFGNCICIHSEGPIYILDDVDVKCTSGDINMLEGVVVPDGRVEINAAGTSVCIAATAEFVIDTTGTMDMCVGDSDGKRAGLSCFNVLAMVNGTAFVDMKKTNYNPYLEAPVGYIVESDTYKLASFCGENENSLESGTPCYAIIAGMPMLVESCSDGTVPTRMLVVPSVVGVPEIIPSENGLSLVSVTVDNSEKTSASIVVFAAYNSLGKMTDVSFAYGSEAVDGIITADLDLSDAERVTVFVFAADGTMKPVTIQQSVSGF